MGNLTRATYANQRMTLNTKLRQRFKAKAEYDDRATWSNPCGVFSSFMFLQGRLAMPRVRRGCMGTRHFFLRRRGDGGQSAKGIMIR